MIQEALNPRLKRIEVLEADNMQLREIIDKDLNKKGSYYKNMAPNPISS